MKTRERGGVCRVRYYEHGRTVDGARFVQMKDSYAHDNTDEGTRTRAMHNTHGETANTLCRGVDHLSVRIDDSLLYPSTQHQQLAIRPARLRRTEQIDVQQHTDANRHCASTRRPLATRGRGRRLAQECRHVRVIRGTLPGLPVAHASSYTSSTSSLAVRGDCTNGLAS